jgi:hypothetical protein
MSESEIRCQMGSTSEDLKTEIQRIHVETRLSRSRILSSPEQATFVSCLARERTHNLSGNLPPSFLIFYKLALFGAMFIAFCIDNSSCCNQYACRHT